MEEDYVPIPDHPEYAVRRTPPYNVLNLATGHSRTVSPMRGLPRITIGNKSIYLHTLFAKLFLEDYTEGDLITWRDGDKMNYAPDNLVVVKKMRADVELSEVIEATIDLYNTFSFRDIETKARTNTMQTREEIVISIMDLRQIFASINSTPKTYVFKDFSKGQPVISVGNKAAMQEKLRDIKVSESSREYHTALLLYTRHKSLFVYDDVCFYSQNPTSFTFYRGYDFNPAEGFNEAIINPFLHFVQEIICDGSQEVYAYIMKWIAQIIQQPATKLETALVILGDTRTGKTTFTNVISHLLGRYAVPNVSDIAHILGLFNDVFENKRFVVVNEVESVHRSRRMCFDKLKTIISDKTVSYNRKYGKTGQGDNTAHFVFVSNNPIPIPIEPGDARFCVVRVSSERKEDHDYFADLNSKFDVPFFEHLMYFFQNIDLTDFEHRDIPLTEVKALIQDACASHVESFVREQWQQISDITGRDLFAKFQIFCKENSLPHKEYTKKVFLVHMREYTGDSSTKKIHGHTIRVYNLLPQVIEHLQQIENPDWLG